MRLRCFGIAACLSLAAGAGVAQTAPREYRPQVYVTSPYWHGLALSVMTEQRMAMGNLMPMERSQGGAVGTRSFDHGSGALEIRQIRLVGGTIEHRYSPSITLVGPLGAGMQLRDRVRLEMRDVAGTWSRRYQNRGQLEHRMNAYGVSFTPYAFHDISYDTRYSVWNRRQAGVGARVNVSHGTVVEPFWVVQTDTRKTDGTVRAVGMILRVSL